MLPFLVERLLHWIEDREFTVFLHYYGATCLEYLATLDTPTLCLYVVRREPTALQAMPLDKIAGLVLTARTSRGGGVEQVHKALGCGRGEVGVAVAIYTYIVHQRRVLLELSWVR